MKKKKLIEGIINRGYQSEQGQYTQTKRSLNKFYYDDMGDFVLYFPVLLTYSKTNHVKKLLYFKSIILPMGRNRDFLLISGRTDKTFTT